MNQRDRENLKTLKGVVLQSMEYVRSAGYSSRQVHVDKMLKEAFDNFEQGKLVTPFNAMSHDIEELTS